MWLCVLLIRESNAVDSSDICTDKSSMLIFSIAIFVTVARRSMLQNDSGIINSDLTYLQLHTPIVLNYMLDALCGDENVMSVLFGFMPRFAT